MFGVRAKDLCNVVVLFLVLYGVVVHGFMPERIESYSTMMYAIMPLVGAWMAAIMGGRWIDNKQTGESTMTGRKSAAKEQAS